MERAYKVRDGYPLANCAAAWSRHRTITRWCWGLLLGWVPFCILVFEAFQPILKRLHAPEWFAFLPFAAFVLAIIVLGNIQGTFRCPQCGSRFYAFGPWGIGYNSYARNCRNCGLRKYECPSADHEEISAPGGIVIRPRH